MRSNKITKQKNKKGNKKYKRTLKYRKQYGGGPPKSKSIKGQSGTMKKQQLGAPSLKAAATAVIATQRLTKPQREAALKEQYKFISNAPNNVQKALLSQGKKSNLLEALKSASDGNRKKALISKAELAKFSQKQKLTKKYSFFGNAPNNVQKTLLEEPKNSTLLKALNSAPDAIRTQALTSKADLLEFSQKAKKSRTMETALKNQQKENAKTKLPELTKEQRRQELIRLAQNKKLSNNNISKLDALQNTSSIGLATKILSKPDYNRSKFNLVELSLRDKLLQSKSITSANKRKIRGLRNAGQIKNFVNKSSNPKLDEIKNNLRTFLNSKANELREKYEIPINRANTGADKTRLEGNSTIKAGQTTTRQNSNQRNAQREKERIRNAITVLASRINRLGKKEDEERKKELIRQLLSVKPEKLSTGKLFEIKMAKKQLSNNIELRNEKLTIIPGAAKTVKQIKNNIFPSRVNGF